MSLTKQQIRDIKAADPELADLGKSYRDAALIAAKMSTTRTRLVENVVTERAIIRLLGPEAGDAFLTALETFAATNLPSNHPLKASHGGIKRMIAWLKPSAAGIDIGDPLTHQFLDALVAAGAVNADHVAAIKASVTVPDTIDVDTVYQALQD